MKKGSIKIKSIYCKSCKLCIEFCPKGSIQLATQLNEKSYFPAEYKCDGSCTGCGLCAVMCPEAIIEVYRED